MIPVYKAETPVHCHGQVYFITQVYPMSSGMVYYLKPRAFGPPGIKGRVMGYREVHAARMEYLNRFSPPTKEQN